MTLHAIGRFLARCGLSALLFLAGVSALPYAWCARHADAWFSGDADLQHALGQSAARWIQTPLSRDAFQTGSQQFDGEWLFGTYLMSGLGFGQTAIEHPEWRTANLQRMEACLAAIQTEAVRAFDAESWPSDPLAALDGRDDHAAYLGYFNLLLGFHRALAPDGRYNDLHDRISAALVRRMTRSPTIMLETYPGETYPVDNCAVFASVALHARLTGQNRRALLDDWVASFRRHALDPRTGLMFQAIDKDTGAPLDAPRGSGTTLGLYFLSFAAPELSAALYTSARTYLHRTVFGFGGVREYPRGIHNGLGDIDSGPVVMGFGLSPTGFLIGGARIHGDSRTYRSLYASAHAWGAPIRRADRLTFVTGASLGDAILYAMLTAQPQNALAAALAQTPAPSAPAGGVP